MIIKQTKTFIRSARKLHDNQKQDLIAAIEKIKNEPNIGEPKKSDLAGVWVYKFQMVNQLTLLAYTYQEENDKSDAEINLLMLGTHENFYRDMKK